MHDVLEQTIKPANQFQLTTAIHVGIQFTNALNVAITRGVPVRAVPGKRPDLGNLCRNHG